MASLLSKFRIDYSDLTLIPDITKKPQETSSQFFSELIKDFLVVEKENGSKATLIEDEGESSLDVNEAVNNIISINYLDQLSSARMICWQLWTKQIVICV